MNQGRRVATSRGAATTVPRGELDPSDLDEESGVTLLAKAPKYQPTALLGEGGMGEVLLCRDEALGRDVAMKRIHRPYGLTQAARFVREARVQGQLEHPSVVPVHQLGVDDEGAPYFTMRRIRGNTLAQAIDALHDTERDGRAAGELALHKLLAAHVRVCLTVHYAHTRGVVHRDLKPENVMLGDFGEVYVLDWGVAKIASPDDEVFAPDESGERPCVGAAGGPIAAHTAGGDLLVGTPAYMAPEQIRGDKIDARTDVYALGAMLFEILTLVSLHDDASPFGLRHRARYGADARASARAPLRDVPPELEAVCIRATAFNPDARYPSARDLAGAIEQFLAGHRDLATRRELSLQHFGAADAFALEALSADAPADARGRAVEEIGRALALDPHNSAALDLLTQLLQRQPTSRPEEVKAEIEAAFVASRKVGLKRAAFYYTFVAPLFFLAASLLLGLKSAPLLAACVVSFVLSGAVSFASYRNDVLTKRVPWVSVALGVALAITGIAFGPLVMAPTFIIVNTMCHVTVGRREHRFKMVGVGMLSFFVPLALELTGVLPPSFALKDGALVVTSRLVQFSGISTPLFLAVANLGLIVAGSLGMRRYRDALERGEERTLAHAWILRHLVPAHARAASDPPPASR